MSFLRAALAFSKNSHMECWLVWELCNMPAAPAGICETFYSSTLDGCLTVSCRCTTIFLTGCSRISRVEALPLRKHSEGFVHRLSIDCRRISILAEAGIEFSSRNAKVIAKPIIAK